MRSHSKLHFQLKLLKQTTCVELFQLLLFDLFIANSWKCTFCQ